MNETWPEHGGRPEQWLPRFGHDAEREVIDFSANLNPLGPPDWLAKCLEREWPGVDRYPDPDYGQARQAIADAEGVSPDQVRLTNGGAEAIYLAAALHAGKRAVIVQPTFTEYMRACQHYGLEVGSIALDSPDFRLDENQALAAMRESNVVVVCRPNNPTGTLVERPLIERMLEMGRAHDATLVVDEAFVDFLPSDEKLTPLLARYDNVILLRSLTKLYAIPGLRLGYLLANPETVRRAAQLQMPWSVNAPAAALVAPLLTDDSFVRHTHAWLGAELPRLSRGLAALGLRVAPSRANFLLFQDASSATATQALFEHLLRAGILVRHTHNFVGLDGAWLRVAVRDRVDNERLLAVLAEWRRRS